MYKNYKEKKMKIHLFLICFISCSSMHAMDTGDVQVMDMCEETVFKNLMESAFKNDIDQVRTLLDRHTVVPSSCFTHWGKDPLGWAGYHGNSEMTQLLLERGFQLVTSENGHSALHTAAFHKKHEVLRLLLTHPFYIPKQEQIARLRRNFQYHVNKISEGNPGMCHLTGIPERMILQTLCEHTDFEQYTQDLVTYHFACLEPMLTARTSIIDALMTPFEAAQDQGAVACMELLEPRGLEARLRSLVAQKYELALKQILQDKQLHE